MKPSLASPVTWPEIAFIGAVAALLALVSAAVHAQPPAMTDPDLAPWFQSLQSPALGISCCDQADGHILKDSEWRQNGDAYEVTIENTWVPVPAQAVLDRTDNPTGSAVAFWLPGTTNIICFVRPSET